MKPQLPWTIRLIPYISGVMVFVVFWWYWPFVQALVAPSIIQSGQSLSSSGHAKAYHLSSSEYAFYYPELGIDAPVLPMDVDPYNYEDWGKIRTALNQGIGYTPHFRPADGNFNESLDYYDPYGDLEVARRQGADYVDPYGNYGNINNDFYLMGHSSDYTRYPYAYTFAPLRAAETGQVFYVSLDNRLEKFTVVEKKVIHPTDREAFEHLHDHDNDIQRAVLVTCWPLFTDRERLVIVGERSL